MSVYGRKVTVMRHAERVDSIFPGWMRLCFTEQGKYRPYDLNQLLTLPTRPMHEYYQDPPITEMGYGACLMVGRGLRISQHIPNTIIVSPALRCIQTAETLITAMHSQQQFSIEPGLFEYMPWYAQPPHWINPGQLAEQAFSVNLQYDQVLKSQDVLLRRKESPEEYYQRISTVLDVLLDRTGYEDLMIIGHATTTDAIVRHLQSLCDTTVTPRSHVHQLKMDKMGDDVPYCSAVTLQLHNDTQWRTTQIIPPLTSKAFSNQTIHLY